MSTGQNYRDFDLVLCHAYKLGLTEGQEVVGAQRGGKCIGIYIDDERQSSRPPGPRPAGLAANAPSAASPRFKGSTDPVFTAASCIWSVCRQSTLICRRDRALATGYAGGGVFHGNANREVLLAPFLRGRAKITSHFPAGSFGRGLRCSLLTDPWAGYARRSRLAGGQNSRAVKYEFIFARPLSRRRHSAIRFLSAPARIEKIQVQFSK